MKTKFTKGDGWVSCGYRVDVDIADGLSGICEMSDWMPKEEMEANAKLIAAAPLMLQALLEWKEANALGNAEMLSQARITRDIAIKKAT